MRKQVSLQSVQKDLGGRSEEQQALGAGGSLASLPLAAQLLPSRALGSQHDSIPSDSKIHLYLQGVLWDNFKEKWGQTGVILN